MTEDRPPGHDDTHTECPFREVRPVGVTLMNLGNRRDPRAILGLLRVQLGKTPHTPGLLLKAADTALMAEEWLEAVTYANELLGTAGDIRGMTILVDALYQLGQQADLDALWERLAPRLAKGLSGDEASDQQPGNAENPVNRIRMRFAQHLLKRGDLAEGLELRSRLRFMKNMKVHPLATRQEIPWWSARDAGRPLLVICEQGLGEQILWAAAFEELSARHPGSVVECAVLLLPVFQRSFPLLRFVSYESHELARIEGQQYRKIMASELDHALGTRINIQCPKSWLEPDREKAGEFRRKYQQKSSGRRLIGLSWRSHHPHYGKCKSIPLEFFAKLLETPGCDFVSLQYGDVSFDLQAASSTGAALPQIDNSVDAMTDLDTWVAQVAAMDIVMTTSSTTAHTAAALGIPTILMLPTPVGVFYYWGYEGHQTPWHPSVIEIVRANGNCAEAVAAAQQALLHAL